VTLPRAKARRRIDPLTPEQRSETMSRVRSKGTAPEIAVRRLLRRIGARFRMHGADLPGAPDFVFPARRRVVFVHGCFWHRHRCKAGRKVPRTRAEYWVPKLERNRKRDAANRRKLRRLGWRAMAVWECQLKDEAKVEVRLREFLEED
jgi:DNA mismatch endonuclease (patch repair protein)